MPALFRLTITSLLFATLCLAGFTTFTTGALAADTKTVPGIQWGMSKSDVKKLIKRENSKAIFTETICEIPLGLDFFGGLPIFTRDTGIEMLKVYNYGPLYFKDDKLIGMREDIRYLDEFTGLKKRFPKGRYTTYRFPQEQVIRTVFLQKEGDEYVFTNRYFDLYRFAPKARQEVITQVRGSYCWHVKQTSPNLEPYAAEYAQCVATSPRMDAGLVQEDFEQCKRYCAATPEMFSSDSCVAHCESALARVR